MGAWIDGWKDRLMDEHNEDQPPPSLPDQVFTSSATQKLLPAFETLGSDQFHFQISSYFVLLI